MMNPFVQKALSKTHGSPSTSAVITTGSDPQDLDTEDWMIDEDAKTGAIIVDDRLRMQLHSNAKTGAIVVDDRLRMQLPSKQPAATSPEKDEPRPASSATMTSVFALGDNATLRSGPLPATAQTASQQAIWLAKRLNNDDLDAHTFSFRNLGVMTYLGSAKGAVQTEGEMGDISGRAAWLIWRGAYLTTSVSWRNGILIPVYW